MHFKNTKYSYGVVAKTFHWLIFLMIASMIALGFVMKDMPNTPDKFRLFGIHKSLGICMLILVALRLAWKLVNIAPPLPASLPWFEKLLAHVGHGILYVLMFATPIAGWVITSAAGMPVSVFGWFVLPNITAPDHAVKDAAALMHFYLAWAIIITVSLHALAALMHHFYFKNDVLKRMLPFTKDMPDATESDTAAGC